MSWQTVKLGDFLKVRQDRFKPNDEAIQGLKRVDKIDFSGQIYLSNKNSNTDMILVKQGDLLISGINVEKGAIAVYDGQEDITATIHYSSYEFDRNQIDIEFLKLFLISPEFLSAIKEQVPGGIKTEIKPKHLLPLQVIIPKLDEQREIVERFSSFRSKQDSISTELSHQLELVRQFRKACLREAMQGKLVPQDETEESGEDILRRIRSDRFGGGSTSREDLDALPFELPNRWAVARLGSILQPERGISYGVIKLGTEPKQGGVFILRCSNVRFRRIDLNGIRKVTEQLSSEYSRTILQGGEVLINVRGTLGGCAVVPPSLKGYNIAREVAVIPVHSEINPAFLLNVIASPYFQDKVDENLRGIAYEGLNLKLLREFAVPIPPQREQKRIVEKLEKLMAFCDGLEANIREGKTQAETLLQVALKDALEPKESYEAVN